MSENDNFTTVVQQHGGKEAFLAWCEETGTDALSTFDVTDEEWDEFNRV